MMLVNISCSTPIVVSFYLMKNHLLTLAFWRV